MGLSSHVDEVEEVLLADGSWHKVERRSFSVDTYEFKVSAMGFKFDKVSSGKTFSVFGPLTSILAVRLMQPASARNPDALLDPSV
jgi:hypothetical protein